MLVVNISLVVDLNSRIHNFDPHFSLKPCDIHEPRAFCLSSRGRKKV